MKHTVVIAKEISQLLPTFLRHMYPYVFQPMNMPPSQVLALVSIKERGGCTLTELKNEMHVSAPTITGIIDRLERDKFVKRQHDLKDRRVTNVILTQKGEAVIARFRQKIKERWLYILEHMPPELGESVIKTMRQMTKRFIERTL